MDAIEMDDSGKTDATLDGSSAWPIVYNTTLPEVESEIYYETILTIAARVPSMYRAQRRLCTSEE
jgi:ABC-type polysaccharide transport system permease subunit